MSWAYDRRTGHVTDEEGRIVADTSPEYGYAIAAQPQLYDAVWELLAAHRRMDEHPEESCSVCLLARAAIAKANEK